MAKEKSSNEATEQTQETGTAIQETKATSVATTGFEEFAGAGLETVTVQDINIPYITFLQSGSPQVKKGNEKRIEGASEGDIVATGVNRLYKVNATGHSPLNVSVVQKVTLLTEWAPNRGGLQGYHPVTKKDELGIKKTKNSDGKEILVLPNGNEIQETDYLFCVAIPETKETPFFCIMSMAQTKRSSVRELFTKLMFDCQSALPTFAFIYTLGSVVRTKEDWSWVVPTFTKVTSDDGVSYVDSRGIINRSDTKGAQIFETCVNLFKTIKDVGIENFLSRGNTDDYEEIDNTAAGEII